MIHQILLDVFANSYFFFILMQLFIQKLIGLPFNQVSFPVYKIWKSMASAAWTKFKKNFNNLPTKCCRNFILCISFSGRKTTSNRQNVVTAVVKWWIYFWTEHFSNWTALSRCIFTNKFSCVEFFSRCTFFPN